MTAAPRRAAFAFILVSVVLDVLSLGVIIPVLPKLVEAFLGGDTARAARVYGVFVTVWALMQFLFAPFLGALSDRVGRRSVLLISTLGLGLDYILMAVAPTLAWLFVGRVISGITAATMATAGAYIADVTPIEKRAASFGMLGAAWGFGFVLGPPFGGLLGQSDLRLPFWVAGGLTLAAFLYGLFVLPESLPPEKRGPFRWSRANPVGSLRLLRSHPELLQLAATYGCYVLAHQVFQSVYVLYTGYRYGWSARDVGLALAAVGVCAVIVQARVVGRVVARFGERRTARAGLFFGALGFALSGLAPNPWAFLAAIPVLSLMGLFNPSLQALMSRRVGAAEQGQLQGANMGIMAIAGIIGPGVFTWVFATFISAEAPIHLPGAPFFLAAVLMMMGLALALGRLERGADR